MNNEDLLKAVSKIDDKYIEAASEKRDSFAPGNITVCATDGEARETVGANGPARKNLLAKKDGRKFYAQPWFKGACAIVAAFIIFVGAAGSTFMFRGMGAAKSDAADAEMYYDGGAYNGVVEMSMAMDEASADIAGAPESKAMAASDAEADMYLTEENFGNGVFEPYEVPREQKLVYNAFLYLQTENYDESFAALEKLVDELEGYFESQSISNGNYYSSTSRSGYCTVRIPTKNYEAFMNAIGQSWHVVNKDESVSDISEQYYETQDRLDTLRLKEERLHSLLAEATNLSDIITLEDQLSDTEYQIEQFTNAMKDYDKQVDYSTVNISLDEVTQMGNTVGSEGFGKRLVRAIKNGLRNFAEGVADFIVWMGYNVIEIIVAAVVIFLICKFHLIRKLINWIKR